MCMVKSRAGGTGRDPQGLGDLGRRIAHEVVEREDGPLLGWQPTESAFELIPDDHIQQLVGCRRPFDRQNPQVDDPTSLARRLDDADMDEEPMQPRVESIRIAEPTQIAPGDHQCVLQGILGSIDVAEDPLRDREKAVGAGADQVDKRVPITPCRCLDEITIHPLSVLVATNGDAFHHLWSFRLRERSFSVELSCRCDLRRACVTLPSTRRLLQAGIVGPALFVAVLLLEDTTRPGYDARRHFVSLLGLGADGWQQAGNFIVTGLLIATFAMALGRSWSAGVGTEWVPRLLGIVGAGLVADGLFATDPEFGYPPGTPEGLPTVITWHGAVHYVAGAAVFASLAAACVIVAIRAASDGRHRFAIISAVSPVVMLGAWLLSFVIAEIGGPAMGGTLQRVSIVVGLSWLAVLAATVLATGGGWSLVTRASRGPANPAPGRRILLR